jgi:hypothetical protein
MAARNCFIAFAAGAVFAGGVVLYRRWCQVKIRELKAKAVVLVREVVSDRSDTADEELLEDSSGSAIRVGGGKKRVRSRAPFRNHLIRVAKIKFGCPKRTEANRLCIRKHIADLCEEHGVIARHTAELLDFVTEMVFVPTDDELVAAAVKTTPHAKEQITLGRLLGLHRPNSDA